MMHGILNIKFKISSITPENNEITGRRRNERIDK
jgi:hypothetical protein